MHQRDNTTARKTPGLENALYKILTKIPLRSLLFIVITIADLSWSFPFADLCDNFDIELDETSQMFWLHIWVQIYNDGGYITTICIFTHLSSYLLIFLFINSSTYLYIYLSLSENLPKYISIYVYTYLSNSMLHSYCNAWF